MQSELVIVFHDLSHSKAIEDNLRERVAKLESLHDRLISCRVVVEAPHRHHHKGTAYIVRIDLKVPGGELLINRTPKHLAAAKPAKGEEPDKTVTERHGPSKHAAHEDVYVAIRDAFNAAERKLRDHARRHSGAAKLHAARGRSQTNASGSI